jgi:hypothetical protein
MNIDNTAVDRSFLESVAFLTVYRSAFLCNQALDYRLIHVEAMAVDITFSNFTSNNASLGGCLYLASMSPQASGSLIRSNYFEKNYGDQGGVIFIKDQSWLASIENNTFVDNVAFFYGSTFAAPASTLSWINPFPNGTSILSGEELPPFSVTMHDLFSQVVLYRGIRIDFLYLQLRVAHAFNSTPQVVIVRGRDKGMLQGDRDVNFTGVEVVGVTGEYSLLVEPTINYDRSKLFLMANFSIKACASPLVLAKAFPEDVYPRCIQRQEPFTLYLETKISHTVTFLAVCSSGCSPPFGTCTEMNKCSCDDNRDGLSCEFKKG